MSNRYPKITYEEQISMGQIPKSRMHDKILRIVRGKMNSDWSNPLEDEL
jgi:hypothetical protein